MILQDNNNNQIHGVVNKRYAKLDIDSIAKMMSLQTCFKRFHPLSVTYIRHRQQGTVLNGVILTATALWSPLRHLVVQIEALLTQCR